MSDNGGGTAPQTLGWAIQQANLNPTASNVISFDPGVYVSGTTTYVINANVTINGTNTTIDMNGLDRAFFVAGGTVAFNNLTIKNGHAKGGAGGDGAGGGAGLGGAIFVMNGAATPGAGVTLATNVTATGVKFRGNIAEGGEGGDYADSFWTNLLNVSTSGNGGGGGMGGHGGVSGKSSQSAKPDLAGGGGGGGLELSSRSSASSASGRGGGSDTVAGTLNGEAGLLGASAGNGGTASGASGPGTGGSQGGGGGGGASGFDGPESNLKVYASGGGGGGVGGLSAQGTDRDSARADGANGGFGGGGGGSGMLDTSSSTRSVTGGTGGFGGGGGGGAFSGNVVFDSHGGSGGFGGGAGVGTTSLGQAGFGGGVAGISSDKKYGSGGGGLGAGGAIFAMPGASLAIVDSSFGETTSSLVNQVIGGAVSATNLAYGASPGGQLGSDLFLGANTTVTVNSGAQKFTGSLAGYGAGGTPPTLTKAGAGRIELHGSSALNTIAVAEGTLAVGSGSAVGLAGATLRFAQPAAGTATLATVSETPDGPPISLQVGTILLSGGTNVFEIGSLDGLSPNLVLGSTHLIGTGPGAGTLVKAGSGVLTLGPAAELQQFTGVFAVRSGRVITEASFGGNQVGLEVADGAEMILADSQLYLASLSGTGAMTLQNGGRFTAWHANAWSGVIQVENDGSFELSNGGGGRIDLAPGVTATMVESSGFNGTVSGAGNLIVDTLSDVTLAKDVTGFSGGIEVRFGSSLRLASGFTGAGYVQGSSISEAHLTVGGSVGNNLAGSFTTFTVDAPLPTTNLTVGAIGPLPRVGTLDVANGRFRVGQVALTASSTVQATAAGGKHGTAIFNVTSPVGIGGNGTVEVVQFGETVSLPGLAASAGGFTGTVHVITGSLTTPASNTVSLFQVDAGWALIFDAPGTTTARFQGPGSVTASGTTSFSTASPFADFTGRVDLTAAPVTTIAGDLHTAAAVALGSNTLSLSGDLDAPLTGGAPEIRFFSSAPAAGTTARIATHSLSGVTNPSLSLNYAHFVVDGDVAGTVSLDHGALVETSGSIGRLTGPNPAAGTVRFTGIGDRTVGTDGGPDFGNLTLQLGATHLAILSNTTPLQSLANVQMGANSELRVTPAATIVSGNTLSADGAAVVHGAIDNRGTIHGPSGFRTYLVFEDKVTGTGSATGNVKFNGGHNPGTATAGGLPGAAGDPSYHVTVVDGDLALGDRNTLQLDLGGYQRGLSYDGVDVTGEIWLDGTLEILFADGFLPDRPFTYDLIEAGSFFGQFSAFNLPALAVGYSWDTSAVNTTGRLAVIPEPAALAVVGLGGLAVTGLYRRRLFAKIPGRSPSSAGDRD